MPILAAEPSVFPECLFDGFSADAGQRRWWAVYTRARQEKALARQLRSAQVPFYLPLVPRDNLIRGRRVRSHVPLFAGYVFLLGSDEERVLALSTNRVSQMLRVQDQEGLCNDLRQIRRLIESDAPLTAERRLAPGRRVRVKSGVMTGLEGTVVSRRGRCRLFVAVDFLQQGASVAVDDFMLEPVDDVAMV